MWDCGCYIGFQGFIAVTVCDNLLPSEIIFMKAVFDHFCLILGAAHWVSSDRLDIIHVP